MHSVGVDIVMIDRLRPWLNKTRAQLAHIYAPAELSAFAVARSSEQRALEFLASRFAVKEAAYKALSGLYQAPTMDGAFEAGFIRCAAALVVVSNPGRAPSLYIDRAMLEERGVIVAPSIKTAISYAHERTHAIAYVHMWL